MPTIRFPTDGPQYLTLRHRGQLDAVPFEVFDANGQTRPPLGELRTLEDLDRWMLEHGYRLVNQRPDYRGRRGRLHHVIADVVRDSDTVKPAPAPIRTEPKADTAPGWPEDEEPGAPKTPPSIHLSLLDAYAIGDLTAFVLRPDSGWKLYVAFARRDAARLFARRQSKARGVKATVKTLEPDCFMVAVPVEMPHRPNPNACIRWSVAGFDEVQFAQTLATAGLTQV